MQAASETPSSAERAARFLAEAGHALASSFELSLTLPRVATMIAAFAECACVIEVAAEEGRPPVTAIAGWPLQAAHAHERDPRAALSERPASGGGLALDTIDDEAWRAAGLEPAAIEPIFVAGQRVGALALACPHRSSSRLPTDLAHELLVRLAMAIDNARRYMRERRVAHSFQTALLPVAFPKRAGRAFHAAYAPATDEAEVGGDWYDAFDLPDGRLAMSIGDVAGHGLEAAVIMGEVRQTFRVAAMENRDPGAVLDMANRLLMLRPEPTMVTALFATYDGTTLTYASAGHPPPVLCTAEGQAERLPISGVPLGVEAGDGRPTWTVTMPPGALLVLYTDGLIECGREVIGGEQALLAAVREQVSVQEGDPAKGIRDRMLGSRRNTDDVAILTFSMEEAPMHELDLRYSATPVASRLVRRSVNRFASEAALDGDATFALSVAIGEAVNNVIEHAYLRDPGTLRVQVRREGSRIVSSVEDNGAWRRARREGRGHGLTIIRSLMDGVEVNLSQGGTVIKMVYETDDGNAKRRATGTR